MLSSDLTHLAKLSPISVQQCRVLVYVSAYPGRGLTQIADDLGLTASSVSRALAILGAEGRRGGRVGLGLVYSRDGSSDGRRRFFYTTDLGAYFMGGLSS